MAIANDLITQLRQRVKDERAGRTAFRFSCTDKMATDCMCAISSARRLTTTVMNGRAASLSVDLTDPAYDTIGALVAHLQAQEHYSVALEHDHSPNHPSNDLQMVGGMSVLGVAASFRHHLFSDEELMSILAKACRRHNLSYTPEMLPSNEETFVITLAHAEICRELAGDATRRRNMDATSDQLLALARDLESVYNGDVRRQQRAIPVAKVNDNAVGAGDIVVGHMFRRSMRTGHMSPLNAALAPATPILYEPGDADVEDTIVTLNWETNHDQSFYAYELWRDTQPNINRPPIARLPSGDPALLRDLMRRGYTSKMVYRSLGTNTNRQNIGWAISVNEAGQLVNQFSDNSAPGIQSQIPTTVLAPPLEPSTTYYYRLFTIDLNGVAVGSNIVAATTKALRALIESVTPVTGEAGDTITVTGLRLVSGISLTLGGKACAITIVSPTSLTFVVPTFSNPDADGMAYDLVLTSANGLQDIYANLFTYEVA